MYTQPQNNLSELSNQSDSLIIDKKKKPEDGFFKELLKFTLLAVCIVLPIRLFIAQPFIVSGSSMYPTFDSGDYLIVDELSYRLNEPKRGDVIIFKYPNDPSKYFIKRIIGLPGEKIDINGTEVKITSPEYPNGKILKEPYVNYNRNSETHLTLPSDEYFVMGDNRYASSDSRVWGPLKKELIIGKAFVQLYPVNKIGINPGAQIIETK